MNNDVHATLARLRAESPVQRLDLRTLFGEPLSVVYDVPALFTILGFEEAKRSLVDVETFSSTITQQSLSKVFGPNMIAMDDPEHARNRGLIASAFNRRALEERIVAIVEEIAGELVASTSPDGADLVRELSLPLPMRVTARLLGLPEADLERFERWTDDVITVHYDPTRALAASGELRTYFVDVIRHKREHPGNDLASFLIQARVDDELLTEEEILGFVLLLLPAGIETTYRGMGNVLTALLTHPDQLEAVRRDRSLVAAAMEEGLRWEAPVALAGPRVTTRDVVLGGVEIPAGSMTEVSYSAANRDPKRWPDPDRFDIMRTHKAHLTFAHGPHACLGMQLARFEIIAALNAILDIMPGIRPDPAYDPPTVSGIKLRSPRELRVVDDRRVGRHGAAA